jgi:hypothetical protein
MATNDLRTGGRDRFGAVETLVRSARRDTVKRGKTRIAGSAA